MKIKIDHIALLLILLAIAQYFIISVSTPIVFGDEGHYASTSRWISENHIIPEHHPYTQNDIYKAKNNILPLFFMYETFGFYFGEIGVKLLLPIFSLLTAIMMYIVVKKYWNNIAATIAAFTLLMTPAIVTYGVLGYTDSLVVLMILMAVNFIMLSFNSNKKIHFALSGIFIALALLTKQSALFLIPFLFLYAIFNKNPKKMKIFLTILLVAFIFISPWLIRSIGTFSQICYGMLNHAAPECANTTIQQPEKITGLVFEGRNEGGATEADLFTMGLLNYMRFAHGWTITILLFLSLGLILVKREKSLNTIIFYLVTTVPLILFSTQRAEDTARYLLPMNIGIAMLVGILSYNLYEFLRNKNKYIGYALIILILASLFVYGQEKITTMGFVKQFSPSFIEGCDWVRENTPEDSVVLSIYAYHTKYQCKRKVAIGGDAEEIYLSNSDVSYEHMKLNGIDYVFIMKSLISQQKLTERYPLEFVNYIQSSNKFEKVYDDEEIYGNAGIMIYKVL